MKGVLRLLLLLVLLCGSLLVVAGVLLKMGVSWSRVELGAAVMDDVSVSWQQKLEVRVGSLSITGNETGGSHLPELGAVQRWLQAGSRFIYLFSSIQVERLITDIDSGYLSVTQEGNRAYRLKGGLGDVTVEASGEFGTGTVSLLVDDITAAKHRIKAEGELRFDINALRLDGKIRCNFGDSFPVNASFSADPKGVVFDGVEGGVISDITPFVELFGLDSTIQRWITDYLTGTRYRLVFFKGSLPWDNPAVILDTLQANVRVDNIEYTFAPGLEPIRGEYADVSYEKGVLYIRPHKSRFYSHNGGKSDLRIDFNDPDHITLVADILVNGPADKDVGLLLEYYGIPFPLRQTAGETDTELVLTIDLNEVDVDVRGQFKIEHGQILHDGKTYHVQDTLLTLHGAVLNAIKMRYLGGQRVSADITGEIDFAKKTGEVVIIPEHVTLPVGESFLRLDKSRPLPVIRLSWLPEGNVLKAEDTYWKLGSHELHLGAFSTPVKLPSLSMHLPEVSVVSLAGMEAAVKGTFSYDPLKVDLDWEMRSLEIRDLVLDSTPFPFSVKYDKKLEVKTNTIADMRLNQVAMKVYPLLLQYGNDTLSSVGGRVSYGSFFDSFFSGSYNLKKRKGRIHLADIEIADELLKKDIEEDGQTLITIVGKEDRFVLEFPEVALSITTGDDNSWHATITDLSSLSSRSRFLRKLGITGGTLNITSKDGGKPYQFSGVVTTPHILFAEEGGTSINRLDIAGSFGEDGASFSINEHLSGRYENGYLHLSSEGASFDLGGIISFIKDTFSSDPGQDRGESPDNLTVTITAKDGFLRLKPKCLLLFDLLQLEYKDELLSVSLVHGPGQVLLQSDLKEFELSGKELNDRFMGALIHESTFTGGRMMFSASGSFNQFSAVIEIDETVLKNFKTLNNILAMLDTIPALATFSLPQYTTEGLPIDSTIAGMTVQDLTVTFESIEVKSPVFVAGGVGSADFNAGSMDLNLELTTQARRNMRKVPIFGYVVAGGEEDPSFNLKVTGPFDDPDVDYGVLSDIVTIPYNLIYRTLNLPVHLFEQISQDAE